MRLTLIKRMFKQVSEDTEKKTRKQWNIDEPIIEIINRFITANYYLFSGVVKFMHYAGVLSSYGKVSSYAPEAISNRIEDIRADLIILNQQIQESKAKSAEQYELQLIETVLEEELYQLAEEAGYKHNPSVYWVELSTIPMFYVPRQYAPLSTRIHHIIETEEQLPRLLAEARVQLNQHLPKAIVALSLIIGKKYQAYLQDELITDIMACEDQTLI